MSRQESEAYQAAKSKAMYNSRADKYDDSHHPDFALQMLDFTLPKPGYRVLDLACGTGLVTFPAAKKAGPTGLVVGLDVSDGMLAEAEKKRAGWDKSSSAPVHLFNHSISDLDSLEFLQDKKGSFDLIACCSALVLLEDPEAALKQWRSYLAPGGRLNVDIIIDSNQIGMLLLERAVREAGGKAPYNRSWVTGEQSVRDILGKTGWKVERFEHVNQLGWETRWLDGTQKGAEDMWDASLEKDAWSSLAQDEQLKARAKPLFLQSWQSRAVEHDGKKAVEERDGTWVVVAVASV